MMHMAALSGRLVAPHVYRWGSVGLVYDMTCNREGLHRAYASHHEQTPPAAARQRDARGSIVGPSCSSACQSLGVGGGSLGYDLQSREGVAVSPSSHVSLGRR
jgi:hypothetical protein